MDSPSEFHSLQQRVQKSLVSTVKAANRIADDDLSFQRTINPDVAEQLDQQTSRIIQLSNRLLTSAAKACNVKPVQLDDVEDLDMKWRSLVDVVDTVLEKADTALDEYTGLIKRKEPPTPDTASKAKKPKSTAKVIRNANISKPQVKFDLQPDNVPTQPWKPLLTAKPHAKVPLAESLQTTPNENGSLQYQHPYETEIREMQYPKRVYKVADPVSYQPVEGTSATWVDTYEGVLEMLKDLKKAKEIAVDLEHHDFRTYTGLVSLMQISTREKDWIVDTLQPWRHKLQVLNEAFADPAIIKVFHGAYMDIIWLQRDLGLYVNGLFDTFFACELLYPGKSLAFLLSKFVNFDADKQYQLADWRLRPLPEEMMYYARSDTHYLLYIYDHVRNDLVSASDRSDPDKDYISRALQKSRDLSLSRHEHPDYDEETGEGSRGWFNYLLRHSHMALGSEQFAFFRAMWKWRDDTARKEDESPGYILGQHHIAEIAKFNPQDAKALHSLLPLTAPLARQRVNEMWNMIQQTKAQNGPTLLQYLSSRTLGSDELNGWKPAAQHATLPPAEGEVTGHAASTSKLFGHMPLSTRWEGASKTGPGLADDCFPFPWQKFVQDIDGESLQYTNDNAHLNGELPQETEAAPSNSQTLLTGGEAQDAAVDEEFTLKRGIKRKSANGKEESEESTRSSSEDDDDQGVDESIHQRGQNGTADLEEEHDPAPNGVITIVDPEEQLTSRARRKQRKREEAAARKRQEAQAEQVERQRREAKQARRARKEEKRRLRQQEGGESRTDGNSAPQGMYSQVPFDYSQAAPVMHAGPNKETGSAGGKKKNKGGEKPKVFNPYAKTMEEEGIKGARKAPPVKGERSATFKK